MQTQIHSSYEGVLHTYPAIQTLLVPWQYHTREEGNGREEVKGRREGGGKKGRGREGEGKREEGKGNQRWKKGRGRGEGKGKGRWKKG